MFEGLRNSHTAVRAFDNDVIKFVMIVEIVIVYYSKRKTFADSNALVIGLFHVCWLD